MNFPRLSLFVTITSIFAAILTANAQGQTDKLTSEQISERGSQAVAVVLASKGSSQDLSIGSGVFIRRDGILLTAYHVVKGALRVQVQMKNGEVFDKVQLLGFDPRRDVAALKIQASGVSALSFTPIEEIREGSRVYALSHPQGLTWSYSDGVLSSVRLADEVPGAGQGFRLIQFTAPVSPGSSGGVLMDEMGRAIGIIVSQASGGQNLNFAIPIVNVSGLGDSGPTLTYDTGSGLSLPKPAVPTAEEPKIEIKDPKTLILNSKTIVVDSNTTFFKDDILINELSKRQFIKDLGWVFLEGTYQMIQQADLIIRLDHEIFTFDFTFTIRDRRTSVIIATGKVVIMNGATGAPAMADKIIQRLNAILNPKPPPTKGKKPDTKTKAEEPKKTQPDAGSKNP